MEYYLRQVPGRRQCQFGDRTRPITQIDVCKCIASDLDYIRTAESINFCVMARKKAYRMDQKPKTPIQVG